MYRVERDGVPKEHEQSPLFARCPQRAWSRRLYMACPRRGGRKDSVLVDNY